MGKLDEALQSFRRARRLSKKLGLRNTEFNALANIGLIFKRKNQLTEALKWYRKALAILNDYNLKIGSDLINKEIDLIEDALKDQ